MARDQVCGMDVDERTAKIMSEHAVRTYYFCSSRCKERFDKNAGEYLK